MSDVDLREAIAAIEAVRRREQLGMTWREAVIVAVDEAAGLLGGEAITVARHALAYPLGVEIPPHERALLAEAVAAGTEYLVNIGVAGEVEWGIDGDDRAEALAILHDPETAAAIVRRYPTLEEP